MSTPTRPPGFTYARSADGTSIAYMRLGNGPRLVLVPPVPLTNISGDWTIPVMREVYERFAASFELVLYDGRGTGASQRSVDDLSTDALVADLEAVLDDIGGHVAGLLESTVRRTLRLKPENSGAFAHVLVSFSQGAVVERMVLPHFRLRQERADALSLSSRKVFCE